MESEICYKKANDVIVCQVSDEDFNALAQIYLENPKRADVITQTSLPCAKTPLGHKEDDDTAKSTVLTACTRLYGKAEATLVRKVFKVLPIRRKINALLAS